MKVGKKYYRLDKEELPSVPQKMKVYTDKKTGKKLPYNLGGQKFKDETEQKKRYQNPNGKKADLLKGLDNLKNGDIRLVETTQQRHHGHVDMNLNTQEKGVTDHLGNNIKKYDRKGKVINADTQDKNAHKRKPAQEANFGKKPLEFIHQRNHKKKHAFEKETEYDKNYRDRNGKKPDKGKAYDMLHSGGGMHQNTEYRNRFNEDKRRQAELDKGLKNINKDYDKTTANHFQNPTVEKITETNKKYRDSDAKRGLVVDSHNGKDVNLGNVLHQYMQGYYYK